MKRSVSSGHFKSSTKKESIYFKQSSVVDVEKYAVNVVIIHDVMEHHDNYAAISDFFIENLKEKVLISWMDLKGHGLSSGTRGHLENFDEYCLDLINWINLSQKTKKVEKTFILGHGVGALSVLKAISEYSERIIPSISGLILSNPFFEINNISHRLKNWALNLSMNFTDRMRVPYRFNGNELFSDESAIEKYESDPLVNHYMTLGLYKQITSAKKELFKSAYFVDTPSIFLVGTPDTLSENRLLDDYYLILPKKLSKLVRYRKMRHDMFNDYDRDKLFNEIYNWMKQVCDQVSEDS
jgi:lysophospholipase